MRHLISTERRGPPADEICSVAIRRQPLVAQLVEEVRDLLHVSALIGTHRNALHVFFERGSHDFVDTAVVAQVGHLCVLGLQNPSHDVDRGVVAI